MSLKDTARWFPSPRESAGLAKRRLTYSGDLARVLEVNPASVRAAVAEFRRMRYFDARLPALFKTDEFKASVLYAICRAVVPDVVVETGVASGMSAIGILAGLRANGRGRLYSIDLPGATYTRDDGAAWTDLSSQSGPGWLVPLSLRDRWELKLGPSRALLPEIVRKAESIDLFYHDSEHTRQNMLAEFETSWPRIRSGGVLAADNVNWNSSFHDFCLENRTRTCIIFPYFGITVKESE